MRRLTPLLLLAGLTGCTGFGEFMDHTFSNPGRNPNLPMADSENVRRVRGLDPAIQTLEVEPGNVWPKFDTRDPTLADVANNPGREDARGFEPTTVPGGRPGLPAGRQPVPARGSSTPPGSVQPENSAIPSPNLPPAPPTGNAPRPPGGVVNTPQGPAVDSGGTNGYRQLNTPAGPGAIVVPNGNGTSTVINPNGTVQTIPTPR
jgi:hypothetical protein